jgi:sugar O-acyltransferase (sialic acid O-acetyltransferase NeuD family)
MMEPLVIAGGGGFGREVFGMIQEINAAAPTWNVLGFLDDDPHVLDGYKDFAPWLGPIEHYRNMEQPLVACAIAAPKTRKAVVGQLDLQGARWATLLHPTARIGIGATLGVGCILARLAAVSVNVTVGKHVHFNAVSGVGHDVRLGDFCTLSALVDVCGAAELAEGVFLGSHASVLPRARIGAWARVGAGSVVLRSVREETTVFGVPAKRI